MFPDSFFMCPILPSSELAKGAQAEAIDARDSTGVRFITCPAL
jgi:hypothetical protein